MNTVHWTRTSVQAEQPAEQNIRSAPFRRRSLNTEHEHNDSHKSMSKQNAEQKSKRSACPNKTPNKSPKQNRRRRTKHQTKQEAAAGTEPNTEQNEPEHLNMFTEHWTLFTEHPNKTPEQNTRSVNAEHRSWTTLSIIFKRYSKKFHDIHTLFKRYRV